MATRTAFTIPDDLAAQFLRRVPAQDRSRYVTGAIAAQLRNRKTELIRACEAANNNADVLGIEQNWDAMRDQSDRLEEPWNVSPPQSSY